MRTVVVFPGQGAQYVGMLSALAESEPVVADTLAEADDTLQLPLSRWMAQGPKQQLAATPVTQPAVLAASVAMWRLLRQRRPELAPLQAAGHSLGEYSALVAAGSLSYPDALRLVRLRGQAMQEAVPEGAGAMVAILGLPAEQVSRLCESRTGEGVAGPACYNGPGQVVVAGHRAAVDQLVELARGAGCRGAVPLKVSAPFHTSLLAPAGLILADALASTAIHAPAFPIVQNVDAEPTTAPAQIREKLVAQVTRPVRWQACAQALLDSGAERAVEVGPGTTLSGLFRRLARRFPVIALDRTGGWGSL